MAHSKIFLNSRKQHVLLRLLNQVLDLKFDQEGSHVFSVEFDFDDFCVLDGLRLELFDNLSYE